MFALTTQRKADFLFMPVVLSTYICIISSAFDQVSFIIFLFLIREQFTSSQNVGFLFRKIRQQQDFFSDRNFSPGTGNSGGDENLPGILPTR